jgi:hypothetical protein
MSECNDPIENDENGSHRIGLREPNGVFLDLSTQVPIAVLCC